MGRAPALCSSRQLTLARSSRILEGLPVGRLRTACHYLTLPGQGHQTEVSARYETAPSQNVQPVFIIRYTDSTPQSGQPDLTDEGFLATEPPLPGGVGAQRPQEVDLAEGGPVSVAEVELRVRALPQQESAEPLLA
jgi:hypothetical protein